MRCLKCLKNNIDKLLYCSGCGSPLPTDVTAVNIPEPFLTVIENQQKEIERLKDIVIGNESYIEKLENNIDEYEEEVDDQSVWADTYFKELQELKEKVRQYEMMYHNTGAMFNRMTMKEKIERYEKALREIAESKEDTSCNEIALKYEVIADKALND